MDVSAKLTALPVWAEEIFGAVDAGDARRLAGLFLDDGQFRFGNAAPVVGRLAIEAAVGGFFGSIRACRHRLDRFQEGPGHCSMDGTVTYLRHDAREVTLPFANVFVLREARIAQYLVFVDLAPLYAT